MTVDRTIMVVFKKGDFRNRDMMFYNEGWEVEIVNQIHYLGMVLSSGGPFMKETNTLSSNAVKAMNALPLT